jgi:hypothetical protein
MISWQGFEQENGLIGFGAMKQQSYSMMRFHQAELTIPTQGPKGGEIHQKGNPTRNHHKKDLMVVMRL